MMSTESQDLQKMSQTSEKLSHSSLMPQTMEVFILSYWNKSFARVQVQGVLFPLSLSHSTFHITGFITVQRCQNISAHIPAAEIPKVSIAEGIPGSR